MYATRLVQLVVVALSAVYLSHALVLDVEEWSEFANDLVRRQTVPSQSSTPTPSPNTPTPTPTPTPTSSPTSRLPTSTPTVPPTSTPPITPSSSSTPPPVQSSSETKTDPETSAPPVSSSTPPPSRSTSTETKTTVLSDGSSSTVISEVIHTPTGSLNTSNGGGTSDITPAQRNIIIGTVVGIGGAIIFGVLGFVAWRIWGKKKAAEENDDLMGGYAGDFRPEAKSETTGSTNGRTPFQSTLESYHAPTQVNTASNF